MLALYVPPTPFTPSCFSAADSDQAVTFGYHLPAKHQRAFTDWMTEVGRVEQRVHVARQVRAVRATIAAEIERIEALGDAATGVDRAKLAKAYDTAQQLDDQLLDFADLPEDPINLDAVAHALATIGDAPILRWIEAVWAEGEQRSKKRWPAEDPAACRSILEVLPRRAITELLRAIRDGEFDRDVLGKS